MSDEEVVRNGLVSSLKHGGPGARGERVERLQAFDRILSERDSLRAALDRIAVAMDPAHDDDYRHDTRLCAICIARQALTSSEKEKG